MKDLYKLRRKKFRKDSLFIISFREKITGDEMIIKKYFKFHSTLDCESKKYENSFVRIIYKIFFNLQNYLTISSFIRSLFYFTGNKKKFPNFVPIWIFLWLIGIIILYFLNVNKAIVLSFFIYRLWEILIVNFWMFLFQQKSQSISASGNKEDNIRFIFLLIIQYFTLIFCFAGLNRYIYSINSNSFKVLYDTSMTWLYHSVVTLTTLGYGDIVPNQNTIYSQISVICETLFGMLFILLFLSVIIKQMSFRYETAKDINNNEHYCFIDLETTGVSISTDRIVEIAIIKILPDESRVVKRKIINPQMPIPQSSTDIHGITNEMVKDAPTFKEVANEVKVFIDGCDLGGYNSNRFDIPVLMEEFLRAGLTIDLSTRKMVDVQHIFYNMEPRTLTAAYKFYCQKELVDAHSAEADIAATIDVFLSQLDKYTQLGNTVESVLSVIGEDKIVDYARRFSFDDKGIEVFNFGKHKGRSVLDVIKAEPSYYDWIMKGDFPLHTKQKLTEIYNRTLLKNK